MLIIYIKQEIILHSYIIDVSTLSTYSEYTVFPNLQATMQCLLYLENNIGVKLHRMSSLLAFIQVFICISTPSTYHIKEITNFQSDFFRQFCCLTSKSSVLVHLKYHTALDDVIHVLFWLLERLM